VAADPYVYGLNLLARRELTTAQLRTRLERRGLDSRTIAGTIDRLTAERALDDRRTARAYARTATRLQARSRRWIHRRLLALGVRPDLVDEALDEVFGEVDEDALLGRVLDRRLRGIKPPLDMSQTRRLYRYLLNQGFDADSVRAAIRARDRQGPADD
jgi:SOS response regulatory protein OraA/RecX